MKKLLCWCAVALILPLVKAGAASCADLKVLTIPEVTVNSADEVSAGPFTIPNSKTSKTVPRFCRVIAIARPTADSVIQFEVWMPPPSDWNGRFEGVGNGGYNGEINFGALANALKRGYAAASTDTGHTGSDLTFGAGHPEKVADWGYRAVHVMTTSAKLIVHAYEGALPRHSYFSGCSTGGHQGLTEAQRFPDDYDGIISGDPGNNRTRLNAGFLWAFAATHKTPGSNLSDAKLGTLHRAVLAACDALDGVKDGVIGDPRRCHFDPATLLCPGPETDACLSAPQIEAVKAIYAGPHNPRTGEQLFPGYSLGSEHAEGDGYGGWKGYITGLTEPMRSDFWKSWVFDDPNWDWRTFDFDLDMAYADRKMAAVNAVDPDLSPFQRRGGKLLMYDGWADPVGPPQDAIDYFSHVRQGMGAGTTDRFLRLFMAPGMGHCASGAGPNIFGAARSIESDVPESLLKVDAEHDVLSALEQWVEHGVPPQRIVALHYANGHIDRTRPVCPYPQQARWLGKGSTDEAENFVCASSK